MRMNAQGVVIEGRQVYWFDDFTTVQQTGNDAAGWRVEDSHGTLLSSQGASHLAAGGGRWAAWPPPRGNFGTLDPASIVKDISLDGEVVLFTSQQNGGPVQFYGNLTTYNIVPRSIRAVGRGHFVASLYDGTIYSNLLGSAKIPVGVKPDQVMLCGDILAYTTDRYLIVQRFDEPVGYVLNTTAEAFGLDMVRLQDRVKVIWAATPAEINHQFRELSLDWSGAVDVSELRDGDAPPPPPPPPPSKEDALVPFALPDDVYQILVALWERNKPLANGSDDDRRVLQKKIAETVCARKGDRWGWKSNHSDWSSPSKDGLAMLPPGATFTPHDRQSLYIWDCFNGSSRIPNPQPIMNISDGTENQYFIPVEPVDHLSDVPPPPPPPPPADTELTARVAAMEVALRALTTKTEEGLNAMNEEFHKELEALDLRLGALGTNFAKRGDPVEVEGTISIGAVLGGRKVKWTGVIGKILSRSRNKE